MTPLTIRRATSKDNLLLAEFGRQEFFASFALDNTPENMALYLDSAFSPELQAAELADPASVFFIAEIDGETAGYARLLESNPPACVTNPEALLLLPGQRAIELVRIYARQTRMRQGIGSRLMQACLEEAAARGCSLIWLGVWTQNPRAIAFYLEWGYTIAGNQSFLLGKDLQTDYVMVRNT